MNMTEVKIKIRAFPYYVEEENPVTGNPQRVERIATRNEVVDLSDADYERAQRFDAFYSEGEAPTDEQPEGGSSAQTYANWLKSAKPTVDETVAAAEGDPDNARALLEAENLVTGQQPRKGVEDGLNDIIDEG